MNDDVMVYESLLRLAQRLEHGDTGMPAICKWVESDTGMPPGSLHRTLNPHFKTWDKFSGDTGYPVTLSRHHDPKRLYHNAHSSPELFWDITTQYGANRRELLIHLIYHLLIKSHADMGPRADLRFTL